MSRAKGMMVAVGISALLVLGVACGNGEAAIDATPAGESGASAKIEQTAGTAAPAPAPAGVPATVPSTPNDVTAPARAATVASSGLAGVAPVAALAQAGSSEAGIWVTGQGTITLEPDLVLLNIGVETMAETVAAARGNAATAMAAIVNAVKARGLEDRDIQTVSFNIWPRYEFPEVSISGSRTRKQVLVGYTVSNTASIKVRDLDSVGVIIDDVAAAGGDATRINGIRFTIEDPSRFMTQLREDAVNDAMAKADQFAALTGVTLGGLVFISETGGGSPVVQDFAAAEGFAIAKASAAPTSISGGDLELRLGVQAVFGIQQ